MDEIANIRDFVAATVKEKRKAEPDGPLPLFPPLPDAEPYPINALGPELSRATKAIASKIQVPPAMAAQSVLAAVSLAACPHGNVRLPFGQSRPLALYFVTIAASGDRKSSADNEALWPIHKREAVLREENEAAMKMWRVAHAAWVAEKRKIEGNGKLAFFERKERLAAIGEEPERPLAPLLVTGNLTVEGLTKNWPTAHAALGLFTSEGGMFTGGHGMNDDNRLKTAATLSELWDGAAVKRMRAQDGILTLPGRRLSVHLMLQPEAAAEFFANKTLRDQELLSRVLAAAPPSVAGTRFYKAPQAGDVAAIRAYGARLLSILEEGPKLAPGTRNELDPRDLGMSPDAMLVWCEFYDHVESQCGVGNDLAPIGDFAAKAAEHAARIAGVMTLFEDLHAQEIGVAIMRNALTIADWHIGETLRLAAAGRTNPHLLRAAGLLEWLKAQPGKKAGFREMLQFGPNSIRTKALAEEALSILTEHGWTFEVSGKPRVIGVNAESP
ncbi:MAG: DUF3987 domain-containing protein [Beijerinckiaceae bacterium]|nr:DUF3987 domain-containing protein [Beijerinckiaceae bacterium]